MNERPQNVLKDMNFQQKAEYIFDYYKFHIGAAFAVIFIIVYILNGIFTHKDTVFSISAANLYLTEGTESFFTTDFLKEKGIDTRKNKADLYSLAITRDESESGFTYASHMKLMTMISAENLDVIFMDDSSYELFATNGYLTDLSYLTDDSSMFSDGKTDRLVIPASPYFEENGSDKVYVGIAINSPHKGLAEEFIKYILKS
ncbi:hypothetical protein SAMN06296386_11477 [Lachnospiraceae bacterium]|nr:hypothetical protein SAMN06296386_11477 [Lachnospiraceae bacterium]